MSSARRRLRVAGYFVTHQISNGPSTNRCLNTGLPSLISQELLEMLEPPEVQVLGVPAKVHTSHGVRGEEILRAFREGPNASAREAPKAPAATTTQQLDAVGIWASVVPLCSQLLFVGL